MPSLFPCPFGLKGRHKSLPLESLEHTSWWQDVRIFRRKIPQRLSFEEILRKETSPPCSLDQFMDYLIYVEHNAETLQFFLWYCSYVERWSQLPEREKELSPVWNTRKSVNSQSQTWSMMLGERTERLNRMLAVLEQGARASCPQNLPTKSDSRASTNFSRPRTPTPAFILQEEDTQKWQWEPFGGQPFRDEVTQIARHYISTTGPRKLNLSYRDRSACMHALQHTTHPSAFLPVFIAVETALRKHSHPDFIRWSTRNSNSPWILFARVVGALLMFLGIILDIILILSRLHRLTRLSAVPFWYIGLYIMLMEGRGIGIGLYVNHKRQLRPWEQIVDAELQPIPPETTKAEHQDSHDQTGSSNYGMQETMAQANPTSRSEIRQPLGSANGFEEEAWVQLYQEKPAWQKIFDVSVLSHNKHLRALQDRTVLISLLWAGFLVIALTVVSVLIPSGDLF